MEAVDAIAKVPPQVIISRNRRSSEPFLLEIVSNIISALVIAPGHPQEGPFFLIKRLLNVLGEYSWASGNRTKIALYIKVAQLLCAYSQKKLPYHVAAVESNDTLYASANKYQNELRDILKVVMDAIVQMTSKSAASDPNSASELGSLQLQTFMLIISSIQFTVKDQPEIAKVVAQLFKSAQVSNCCEKP